MPLDITALTRALASLEDILKQEMNEYIRDGVIQRFEYTFELSWKTIRRYYKEIGRIEIPNGPKPLIREAAKDKLIDNVDKWFLFLDARNISSHIYNEEEAIKVYSQAKKFPPEVNLLLKNLNPKKKM